METRAARSTSASARGDGAGAADAARRQLPGGAGQVVTADVFDVGVQVDVGDVGQRQRPALEPHLPIAAGMRGGVGHERVAAQPAVGGGQVPGGQAGRVVVDEEDAGAGDVALGVAAAGRLPTPPLAVD
jgi:hypothetical protein